MAGVVVAPRSDRANIESIRLERLQQRQVVELGVMRERHHAAAPVGLECRHHVVWHVADDLDPGHGPGTSVFLARVAHRHRKAAKQRHGRQIFGQLSGSDQQHAVLRTEAIHQHRVGHTQRLGRLRQRQRDLAVAQSHAAQHQPTGLQRSHEIRKRQCVGVVFQQQLQRAAARKAESVRLVGGDAVLDQGRRARGHARRRRLRSARTCRLGFAIGAAVPVDQVVFNATARYRPDHGAVFTQRHDRPHRAR